MVSDILLKSQGTTLRMFLEKQDPGGKRSQINLMRVDMNIPYSLFCAIVLLTATIIPALAEPGSHSPQLIVLDQKVHVLTADGSDLLLDEGTYQLEAAEEWIRVIPDHNQTAAWLLEAHKTQHGEALEQPAALLAIENSDDVHMLILLPNGKGLEAIGSISGVRSRAAAPPQQLSQVQIRQRLIAQPGISMTRPPGKTPSQSTTPLPPQITAYTFSPPYVGGTSLSSVWPQQPVPYLNLMLKLTIEMGEGASTPYTQLQVVGFDLPPGPPQTYSGCFFYKNETFTNPTQIQIDPQGRAEVTASGWFRGLNGYPGYGNCGVRVRIKLAQQNGIFGDTLEVVYLGIPIAQPTVYAISNTWSWKSLLGFKSTGGIGFCTGNSVGVPTSFGGSVPTYPVGVLEYSNDLSLRIRSGPLGPDCEFTSKVIMLPNGTRLRSLTWKIAKTGANQDMCRVCTSRDGCRAGPSHQNLPLNRGAAIILNPTSWPNGDGVVGYSITTHHRPVLTPDQVIVYDYEYSELRTFLLPMWTRLQCGNTVTNDHGVRLVLDTIELEGPPGLTFP